MNHTLIFFFILLSCIQLLFNGGRLDQLWSHPGQTFFYLLAILLSLVIHEFAHALAADKLGDPNPRLAGRLSLNPLKHLDPLGTLLIIVAGFGWGKPVVFDPYNLKNPARDGAIIAFAGPASNLLLAVIMIAGYKFLPPFHPWLALFLSQGIIVNVGLAIFNLLPLYPLDGHHILRAFFNCQLRAAYDLFNRRFGYLATLVILFMPIGGTTIANSWLTPIYQAIMMLINKIL